MEKIKQWAVVISAVSVISGLLLSVIPSGKLRPAFKSLISIILVYTFMLGFIDSRSIDFDIGEYLSENYEVSESLDKYALQGVVSSAQKATEQLLYEYAEENKLSCKFEVECGVGDEEVFISKIIVTDCESAEEKEKIISLISGLGFDKALIKIEGEADEQ